MKKILIATANNFKQVEYINLLEDIGINKENIVTLSDVIETIPEINEYGLNFHENAKTKSETFSNLVGENYIVLSDDSGLVINSLSGRPGLYSHEYADTNSKRINKVLEEMVDKVDKSASFICVVSLSVGGQEVFYSEGNIRGSITTEITGDNKSFEYFNYDGIFIPKGFDKTFGEMSKELKNTISHRKKAVEGIRNFLENYNR